MKKSTKIIIGVIALFVVIGVIGALGKNGDSNQTATDTNQTQQAKPDTTATAAAAEAETPKQEAPQQAAFTCSLSAGNYTSGVDFPSGTYNIKVKSGSGNVSSSNMYDGGLNEVMGKDDTKEFNNAKLDDGVSLTISSDLVIDINCDKANTSEQKKRENSLTKTETLASGNFKAGKDFAAGTYDIELVKGNGNVSSSNLYEGGLNEIFGTDKGMGEIKEFKNADLKDGTELTLSGVSVKLVPSVAK